MCNGDGRTGRLVGLWGWAWLALVLLLSFGARPAFATPVGQITEFTAGFNANSLPGYLTTGSDGDLWFADSAGYTATSAGTPALGRFDPSTDRATEFRLPGVVPNRIVTGSDGDLWFTELNSPGIGRFDPSTQKFTQFSSGLPADRRPEGIALGADGNVWFVATLAASGGSVQGVIGRIDPSTGQVTEFTSGLPAGSILFDITAGPGGDLWFVDQGTPAIGRIDPSTGEITEFATGLTTNDILNFVTAGPAGSLWFTDGLDNGNSAAVGRLDPATGTITKFTTGLPAGDLLSGITAGQDGAVWFTLEPGVSGGAEGIGRIDPSNGKITVFTSGLSSTSGLTPITAGPDGNVWFTDPGVGQASAGIGQIGTGAPAAVAAAPVLSGSGVESEPLTCNTSQARFSSWQDVSPSESMFSFDGLRWLLDGVPVAGQTGPTFTPSSQDVGHQVACSMTASYPSPFSVNARASSAAITVKAPVPVPVTKPAPVPAVTALKVHPKRVSVAGRKVHGRCVAPSEKNRHRKACTRKAKVTIDYTLSTAASVTFKLSGRLPGHKLGRRCVAQGANSHKHKTAKGGQQPVNRGQLQSANRHKGKKCTRRVAPGKATVRTGAAGANKLVLRRKLAPGKYTVTVTPTGGRARRVSFKVVR